MRIRSADSAYRKRDGWYDTHSTARFQHASPSFTWYFAPTASIHLPHMAEKIPTFEADDDQHTPMSKGKDLPEPMERNPRYKPYISIHAHTNLYHLLQARPDNKPGVSPSLIGLNYTGSGSISLFAHVNPYQHCQMMRCEQGYRLASTSSTSFVRKLN